MHDLGQNMTYLTFEIESSSFQGHPRSLTLQDPCLPTVAKFGGFGGSLRS